ncbi:nuclear pore complex protein Nup98-Nup96-like [Elysia marginata]|uniref:Nuclear pore complex protein Nup98-Nup96 n=1 Tax=Elysia marginata TaxID=1093978 RepID=A0AAV4H3J6_9GAST|nr:nuclear pore complex protein Nup98-Nup96-like [Elysia marginata]
MRQRQRKSEIGEKDRNKKSASHRQTGRHKGRQTDKYTDTGIEELEDRQILTERDEKETDKAPLSSNQHDNTIENEAEAVIHGQSTPLSRPPEANQNNSLDDSFAAMNHRVGLDNQETPQNRLTAADTTTSYLDTSDLDNSVLPVDRSTPHPTGVTLTRPGYFTIPALDDMVELMDENGNCYVEDLTIGRENYGSVFFPGITNVAGMNLDDLVHFRRREIVIYPDDEKKPPLGDGLNKKAEVTLDCVWPTDKSNRTPIKSPERLKLMSYAEKLQNTTARIGAKFIDYRPETGSWVFKVNHFSKYGLLDDSDDEGAVPMDAIQISEQQAKDILLVQKLKTQQEQLLAKQKEALKSGQGQLFSEDIGQRDMETFLKRGEQDMMQGDDDFSAVNEEDEEDKFGMQDTDEPRVKKYLKAGLDDDEDMDASMDSKFLASSMGVSAQNIQGMKASFFGDNMEAIARKKEKKLMQEDMGDYEEDMRSLWKKSSERTKPSLMGLFKYPTSLSLPQSPAFSDRSEKEGYEPSVFGKPGLFDARTQKEVPSLRPTPQTFMQPPVMEHKLLPSGLQPGDLPQRIKGTRIYRGPVHFRESLLHNNQAPLIDAACFMGRSFRAGWGPTWTLAHSGSLMGLQEEETQNVSILPYVSGRVKTPGRMKGWLTHVEQIQVTDYMDLRDGPICRQQEQLLEVQLRHSRVSEEEGCPRFIPAPGVVALHELADLVRSSLTDMETHPDISVQTHMDSVLCLCVALWGNLPNSEDLEKDDIYLEQQLRREAVSKWLAETSASKVAQEMEACPLTSPEACLRAVFSKLTVRQVSSACRLAQRAGDFRLALLLAQIMGGPVTRQMLAMQLANWAEQGAIEFMSELRQKVYCLLAGQLVWDSRDTQVNTCEGLDWKRALAMHMWYKSPANASVQHSLRQYQHGFQGAGQSKAYCAPPLPPYLESEKEDERGENEHIYDTAYHVLCLYSDRSHSLEALLSPTSSTPAHLDFRLSWQLHQVLMALGYSHLPVLKADSLHESFASQLETLGMWHWAAFVLLHLSSGARRHAAVSALMQRHVGVGEELTDRENFLVEKLHIPAAWLHNAKAVKAHSEGNHDAEARHLILAGQFNASHTVVVRHVATDAIINDNDDYLKSFLDELALPDRCIGILNWNSNGSVFLDFINLRRRLEQLKKSQPTTRDMEELEPTVMSLCGRVKGLTCLNSKDRLCQAEMAKTSASLLRSFLALRGESPFKPLTNLIPDLPMSEDYTLQELQALSGARLMEIV